MHTSLVLFSIFAMLDMSYGASVPRLRDTAGRRGLPMVRMSRATSSAGGVLNNVNNVAYTVDVTIGGQSFPVQLDTGSADLWVTGQNTQNIRVSAQPDNPLPVQMIYGSGNASGNAMFADVDFGGFTVQNQAFVLATDVHNEPTPEQFQGIMGVGFNAESRINIQFRETFGSDVDAGTTSISNILAQNDVSQSFDILLNRINDTSSADTGTLFIGVHDDSFSDITQQPQLPQVAPNQWSVAMDKLKVNGTSLAFNTSSVPGVPNGKISTAMDSGTSLALLPPGAVDFIYSSIPGAVFVGEQLDVPFQWLVPCTGVTNVTFTYGGVDFPIHYLDLTKVQSITLPIPGPITDVTICSNAYQYLTLDPEEFSGFDALIGDAFLRNVYASFNFGIAANGGASEPFIQMISTTAFDIALPDFQTSRAKQLASLPPEMSPADLVKTLEQAAGGLAPSATGQNNSSSSSTASSTSSTSSTASSTSSTSSTASSTSSTSSTASSASSTSFTASSTSSTSSTTSSSSSPSSTHNGVGSLRGDQLPHSLVKGFVSVAVCILTGAALI